MNTQQEIAELKEKISKLDHTKLKELSKKLEKSA